MMVLRIVVDGCEIQVRSTRVHRIGVTTCDVRLGLHCLAARPTPKTSTAHESIQACLPLRDRDHSFDKQLQNFPVVHLSTHRPSTIFLFQALYKQVPTPSHECSATMSPPNETVSVIP